MLFTLEQIRVSKTEVEGRQGRQFTFANTRTRKRTTAKAGAGGKIYSVSDDEIGKIK